MTLDQAKEELIKRYKYLYDNASFILAPFMYEQTEEEYKVRVEKDIKKYGRTFFEKPLIYLNLNIKEYIVVLFEEFLLDDIEMECSSLYQLIESKRNDKEYLERVKRGLELVEKRNKNEPYLKTSLNIWEILSKVWDRVKEQSGDLKNKENKLKIIDEYCRIYRYQNNGKIYTSGHDLNLHDCNSLTILLHERKPSRDRKDTGVTKNAFITILATAPRYEDNWSIFTEQEKQEVYLQYHDELPCDLEIACNLEEDYRTRLIRPEHTSPCGEYFYVNEREMFCNPISYNPIIYSENYYQLCPHCGYIVNIPKEILSPGIRKRIQDRCRQDRYLSRKMYLYSELFSLDKNSTKGQRKMLKKD